LDELVKKGLSTAGSNVLVKLPAPTLVAGMTGDQQRIAIEKINRGDDPTRLLKKSVAGPFILEIESVGELPDNGKLQQVDLWFVAHGKLSNIENRQLFEELAKPNAKNKNGPPECVRELTPDEFKERGLTAGSLDDGSKVSYGVLQSNVLDKAYLTGMTFSQGDRSVDTVTMAFRLEPKLKDDKAFPTRWYSLKKDDDGNLASVEPSTYSIACAYAKATKLLGEEEAIFVEVHLVFAEPFGWFEGRNLLRSKLPLLLQDAVRTFRRKLAE